MQHVCALGETSETIAAQYGIGVRDLVRANPLAPVVLTSEGRLDFARLELGEPLRVPIGFYDAGAVGAVGTMGADAGAPAGATATATDPATTNIVWTEIFPDSSGDFTVTSGQRYAGLASVSLNYTLTSIVSYLTSHGWTVTYSWEYGTPTRETYQIDTWLDSLTADPTSNHRWVYVEANRTGDTTTIGQTPPWPLTIYKAAHIFQALPGPPGTGPSNDAPNLPAANSPGCPDIPSKVPTYLVGGAVGTGLGVLGSFLVRRFL
jgi:hypothetical protein